jgi:hypothetical protein
MFNARCDFAISVALETNELVTSLESKTHMNNNRTNKDRKRQLRQTPKKLRTLKEGTPHWRKRVLHRLIQVYGNRAVETLQN